MTQPFCAVSRIFDKGNTVTFQAEGVCVESPAGVRAHSRRENDVGDGPLRERAADPAGFQQAELDGSANSCFELASAQKGNMSVG